MTKPLLEKSHHCPHTAEQRTLRGTWCTPEIQKAVAMGYTLNKIHEVHHFPPEQRRKGLFADYVNTWLKIKQESAGYPNWCNTPEDKARYVQQYQQKEGIALDPTMIQKNPGRKATAKLMLNSFWGKFGENLHKPTTQVVYNATQLFDLVSNPFNDIRQVRIANDEALEVVHAELKDNQPDNGRINIFVAAFTTCWARLKLYSYLEQLKQQVLYFDTDSVIYSHKPGQADVTARRLPGRDDQRTRRRRFHHRFHRRWTQKLRIQNPPRQSLLQSQRLLTQCTRIHANSTMTSCDKIYSTNSHNLSRMNDAISTSSTPTSSGETQPPNISESSHGLNATDSSSTNAS